MAHKVDEKSEWVSIRDELNKSYDYNIAWKKAINLFDSRMRQKFFNPAQLVIDQNLLKGEGFTILTIQCAIIEMFAAFRIGKIFRYNTPGKYFYSKSGTIFTSFLKQESIFQDHFWNMGNNGKQVDSPHSSYDFYCEVRCGLMHEARTKGDWLIRSHQKSLAPQTARQFIEVVNGKFVIYRTVLHYRLLEYFVTYQNELKGENMDGADLRKNFARKIDDLFDFMPDITYKWWN